MAKNRIVVDYQSYEGLVLLTAIETKSGKELSRLELEKLQNVGFDVVKKYDGIEDYNILQAINRENAEGYVVKFSNGQRMKIKFDEYVRLHRVLTNFSSRSIWDCLKNGQSLDEFLLNVPDEFYGFVRDTEGDLKKKYAAIENEAKKEYAEALEETPHKEFRVRAEAAKYFKNKKYTSILFSMFDGKDYSSKIWRLIEPEYVQPFKNNEKK